RLGLGLRISLPPDWSTTPSPIAESDPPSSAQDQLASLLQVLFPRQDPPSPCPTDRQSRSYPLPTSAAIQRKPTSAMALPKTSSRSSLASPSYSSSLAIRDSSTRASRPISARSAVT